MNAETELERAYRAIRGFYTAAQKGVVPDKTMLAYHSPTIAAASRFVKTGELDGSEYFIGKHFRVLHEALGIDAAGRAAPDRPAISED
jgi:hypothetical protein